MVNVMLCWDDSTAPGGAGQAFVRLISIPLPGFKVSVIAPPIGGKLPLRDAVVKNVTLFTLMEGSEPLAHAMCEVEWV
jgi:hypothetical protein